MVSARAYRVPRTVPSAGESGAADNSSAADGSTTGGRRVPVDDGGGVLAAVLGRPDHGERTLRGPVTGGAGYSTRPDSRIRSSDATDSYLRSVVKTTSSVLSHLIRTQNNRFVNVVGIKCIRTSKTGRRTAKLNRIVRLTHTKFECIRH